MAVTGTEPAGVALTPREKPNAVEGPPPSKLLTLWQTLKPFGWSGLLLVAVLVALYAPVLRRLALQWYVDPDYSHGFLVPFLSAFLL